MRDLLEKFINIIYKKDIKATFDDDFSAQFDNWVSARIFQNPQYVYCLSVKGNKHIGDVEGTFHLHKEYSKAEKQRKELQPMNSNVILEVRKIAFDYIQLR